MREEFSAIEAIEIDFCTAPTNTKWFKLCFIYLICSLYSLQLVIRTMNLVLNRGNPLFEFFLFDT